MMNDLRLAIRTLRKNILLTTVAVITLAIGIGSNTAIFSIVNGLLVNPLPYREANRLFTVHQTNPDGTDESKWMTREEFVAWQEGSKTIEQLAALNPVGVNVRIGNSTHRVQGARVSSNFFSLLGISAFQGRIFNTQDAQSRSVAILDYGFWQESFGGNPDLLGRTIFIDSESYTVIGVLRKSFDYHLHQDVWLPLRFTNEELNATGDRFLHVIARLKVNDSPQQAEAELNAISRHTQKLNPAQQATRDVRLIPLQKEVVGEVRSSVILLQLAVGFVLLIIFVNLANLLMAQSLARQNEIAVRLALGAGRLQIVRQFMAEGFLLSAIGGCAGLFIAWLLQDQLLRASAEFLPFTASNGIDFRLPGFAILLSIFAGAFVGIIPVLQFYKGDLFDILKTGSNRSIGGSHTRWRALLVIVQVALSVVLLIGSGLMIKSFSRLQSVNPGFNPSVLKLRIALPVIRYPDEAKRLAYYQQGIGRLRQLPGVESVAMINWLPFSGITAQGSFEIPQSSTGSRPGTDIRVITPEYFDAMRIPFQSGRAFNDHDDLHAAPALIVTQSVVRKYFLDTTPIGQVLKVHFNDSSFEGQIVGVVADVHTESLDSPPQPAIYVSYLQAPWNTIPLREFVVRTNGNPETLANSARQKLWSIDPDVPVYQVSTMSRILDRSLGARRVNRNVITLFGMAALLLVLIGIYGLTSFSVYRRTREIGVRVALGATRNEIAKLIVFNGLRIAAVGIALGSIGGFVIANTMQKLLFGINAADPTTFVSISVLILLVTIAASCFPALRAARMSPLTALRHE